MTVLDSWLSLQQYGEGQGEMPDDGVQDWDLFFLCLSGTGAGPRAKHRQDGVFGVD